MALKQKPWLSFTEFYKGPSESPNVEALLAGTYNGSKIDKIIKDASDVKIF